MSIPAVWRHGVSFSYMFGVAIKNAESRNRSRTEKRKSALSMTRMTLKLARIGRMSARLGISLSPNSSAAQGVKASSFPAFCTLCFRQVGLIFVTCSR